MSSVPKVIHHYSVKENIGSGSFSSVYKVVDTHSKQTYAMKVFPKTNLEDQGDQERFQREINAMTFMKHDNLISLHNFFWDENNFYLIMDYCQEGELFDYIVDHDKLPEPVAAYVFRQIVLATAFCHSFGVAHRDLKPENVLIDHFPHIKVSDFGLCGFIGEGKLMKTFCGSPCYCAPECLCRIQYDGRVSDVWSLGVILFAMVTGEHPWNISNTSAMLRQILKGQYHVPPYVSPQCKDLICGMLKLNTHERITMKQIAEHPWLAKAMTIPQGKYLSPSIELPALQPVSLQELSEASARNSTRSDCGIYSPFSDTSDSLQASESDECNTGSSRIDMSALPMLKGHSASTIHVAGNAITNTRGKDIKRIAPMGLRISSTRQKSSANLLNSKFRMQPSRVTTIIEE